MPQGKVEFVAILSCKKCRDGNTVRVEQNVQWPKIPYAWVAYCSGEERCRIAESVFREVSVAEGSIIADLDKQIIECADEKAGKTLLNRKRNSLARLRKAEMALSDAFARRRDDLFHQASFGRSRASVIEVWNQANNVRPAKQRCVEWTGPDTNSRAFRIPA